jgi:anthranilate phosphoribosyltransferase
LGDHTWPDLITTLVRREPVPAGALSWAWTEIVTGQAVPEQLAAFLIALRAKGEQAEELAEIAQVMLDQAIRVEIPIRALDIVGTGGDRARTVNISTMSAIVAAGAGVPVVKHGGRAASSAAGAADVLGELGITLDLTPEEVTRCFEAVGITFCFAPRFHPGMRHAGPVRRALGVPTVFNVLGPLINPAQPAASLVGCADERMAGVMAGVYALRGGSVIVARGQDGLDEITTADTTRLWVAHEGRVREELIDVRDFGIASSAPGALTGGDPAFNAEVVRKLVAGDKGAVRDAVIVNTAAAIAAYEGHLGDDLRDGITSGITRATEAIDSGAAAAKLQAWADFFK